MINDKSNLEVLRELNNMVYGHESVKKQLINFLNRGSLRHHQKYIEGKKDKIDAPTMLLVGSSGTGKTHLIQSITKIVGNRPLIYIDATRLNPTGADKGIKSSDIRKIVLDNAKALCTAYPTKYHSVEGTMDLTVVFVDEVDKLGSKAYSSGWNSQVQANFLTVFEDKNGDSGTSFIFAGAFTHLTNKNSKHADKKHSIGFFPKEEEKVEMGAITDDDLIEYGLLPEFVGRIGTIAVLDDFSNEDYKNILNETLLPVKIREMLNFNFYDVSLSEDEKEAMCKKALKSGQGVRSLKRELDKMFIDKEFDFEDREEMKQLTGCWTEKLI